MAADSTNRTTEGLIHTTMPLASLLTHLEEDFHAKMKESILRVRILFDRIAQFSPGGTVLASLVPSFDRFRHELEEHLLTEERVLFPHIRRLLAGQAAGVGLGPLDGPLGVMEHEHRRAGELFEELRRSLGSFEAPEGADGPTRMLYAELADLWDRFAVYVEIENEVLHPRTRELERALASSPPSRG